MPEPGPQVDVYEYILEKIDSVPHLEAVILLWNSRPVGWTADELASRLYVPSEKTVEITPGSDPAAIRSANFRSSTQILLSPPQRRAERVDVPR